MSGQDEKEKRKQISFLWNGDSPAVFWKDVRYNKTFEIVIYDLLNPELRQPHRNHALYLCYEATVVNGEAFNIDDGCIKIHIPQKTFENAWASLANKPTIPKQGIINLKIRATRLEKKTLRIHEANIENLEVGEL